MSDNMDKVVKAAEELDRMVGKVSWLTADWREKIDLDKLDMGSTRNCILGQLEGDYGRATDDLEPKGFRGGDGAFASFGDEWIEYLKSNNKFAKGTKWVSRTDSDWSMTIQGTVEIDGKGKMYVYLTNSSVAVVRTASYIEGTYKPAPKVPDFTMGDEVVFPGTWVSRLFFLSGDDVLKVTSSGVMEIVSLDRYTEINGDPTKGSGNKSAILARLKDALNK